MTATLENEYKMTMTLNIRNISAELFGGYRCVVRNSLGETDGLIRLYGMRDRQRENIITVLFKPPLEYDRSDRSEYRSRADIFPYYDARGWAASRRKSSKRI